MPSNRRASSILVPGKASLDYREAFFVRTEGVADKTGASLLARTWERGEGFPLLKEQL